MPVTAGTGGQTPERYRHGLFSHTAPTEAVRLRALEGLCDPVTREILDEIGVRPHWRCLELGGGAGSVARELAGRCPDGRMVVTDLDTGLLRDLPDGVEVVVHDVTREDFPPASFDLIHTRALLMHLRDPAAVVGRIAQWLAPGGYLVVEDPTMFPADSSPHPLLRRVMRGFEQILAEDMGSDSRWGRRLPAALAGAGLTGLRMISTPVMVGDGGPGDAFWRVTLAQSAQRFIERGLATSDQLEELLRLFEDPAFLDISFAVTSAWGRRAPA